MRWSPSASKGGQLGRVDPCIEFLQSAAMACESIANALIHGLACHSDGIDGSENYAGAWFCPSTLSQARNELVVSGPTRTNVNDFRAITITPA